MELTFSKLKFWDKPKQKEPIEAKENLEVEIIKGDKYTAAFDSGTGGRMLFTHSFNGEKNLGEVGPVKSYILDYATLRARSWQSYLESEITQTVIKRFRTWVIGTGLKLQSEPSKLILSFDQITVDQKFNESVEALWSVYSNSKTCDYAGMKTLGALQKRAYTNAKLGGDVLVVLRVIDQNVKVQLVDGAHVCSPDGGSEISPNRSSNGNYIKNGIEVDASGQHVAYHVRDWNYKFERIPAKGASGLLMAYMVYGSEYRLESMRGMPLISTVMETLAKLDRYKEASVGSAEERSKVPYFFEHDVTSTGENPLTSRLASASNFRPGANDQLPVDAAGNALASSVSASTNKQVFNMPIGAKVKAMESKQDLFFKDFYTTNIGIVCAAIGIPPEVALSKYDSNFSASRAALKDWEHTLNVERSDFSEQFNQPIFNLWLELQILRNKVQAPGYIKARMQNNDNVIEAYRCCRWVGPAVPHIDPLKEVNAERRKLGILADHIPLTTIEAATERLNGGEAMENMAQFSEEIKKATNLGIAIVPDVKTTGKE
jgi:capsid protein